jgi:hypothetical protein
MLKITGTMMLVLMLTTLTASAGWLTVATSDQSSEQEAYLTADTTWNGNGLHLANYYHNNNMTYDLPVTSPVGMMWLSQKNVDVADAWVAYDFGGKVTVDGLTAWNFNDVSQLSSGIQAFRILYTTETGVPLASRTWINAGTDTMTKAGGWNNEAPNTEIELPGLEGKVLTGIKLEVIRSYGSGQVGLSEIRFDGEVVPEPATMGLLAVGGIAMLRSRRRRNNK